MRVVHIITRLIIGGAQENTILNCADLIDNYHDEVLLVAGPGLGPEGSLEADARKRGIPLELVSSLRRPLHAWRDTVSYRNLRSILQEYAPDVVHTHSGKAGMLGRCAAWSLGIPAIVHTIHGAPFHRYQSALARRLFRRCEIVAARRCHAMISVADAMTDLMVAAHVAPREMFTTIYSGMETEPYLHAESLREATRNRLGFAPDDVVAAKVARLFHLKGHEDLLEAAAAACAESPRLRFLLVGDGILRDRVAERIRSAGLTDRFHCVGLVSPDEIPALLAASDMVVHTSLREGLARVLPQALLSGRPAISYDIDGAREVVVDDETGYLIAPGDVKRLAAQITRLAADAALRERLGAQGRQMCATMFGHEQMTCQVRKLYERLLERPTARSTGGKE